MSKKSKKRNSGVHWWSRKNTSRSGRKTKAQKEQERRALIGVLRFFLLIGIVAGIAVGLVYLDRYVRAKGDFGKHRAKLVFEGKPEWVSDEMNTALIRAAIGDDAPLIADENAAYQVAKNLSDVSWIYNVQVFTRPEQIRIKADFYEPLLWISAGGEKYYLAAIQDDTGSDYQLVVMDYVPVPKLNTIEVRGVDTSLMPPPGSIWQREDASAAVKLLICLRVMDQKAEVDKPLLDEVAAIDVKNFGGRKNRKDPHIIIFADDGTPIFWGARFGASQRYLEAVEEEKLAMLYSWYKEYGTIRANTNGHAKYIDLRMPRKKYPMP